MEKIFVVITTARQRDGEMLLVKTEKAFKQEFIANNFVKTLRANYAESDGKLKPQKIETPVGIVDFFCEVSVLDTELES